MRAAASARRSAPTRAERNIAWIEKYLRIPEGKHVGKPVRLPKFMRDDLRAIYDNKHDTRRGIISRARKNAKTTQSAFLLLLHLCGPEARYNSQLYSAAQSRDQASLLFAYAAKMVRMSPEISGYVIVRDTAKQLFCPDLGTLYRALSAEAATAYGLSPAFVVHDELGQVKGPRSELYDAIESATAGQEHPLSIIISTQAPTDADLLSILIDDAKQGHDPRTILRLDTAPEGLDPFSERAIRAANPAFDEFMNQREVLDMAETAKRMPSAQASFENLVLNRRVESRAPFVSRPVWESCRGEVPDFDLHVPVFAGLDLSEVSDLTAFVMVGLIDGKWRVRPTFWLPGDTLAQKARADRVPYDVWRDQGYLIGVPGKTIQYDYVAQYMVEVFERYTIAKIAFDRWNWRHFKPALERAGFGEPDLAKFVEFGQGFQSMSPALRTFEAGLLNGDIVHDGHPVMTMCAANAVPRTDAAGNRKLAKDRSHGRIDGMVALAMAMGVAGDGMEHTAGPSVYETRGFLTL